MTNSHSQEDNMAIVLELIEEVGRTRSIELDLSGLDLTEVPEELGQLSQLETLDLSYNQLTEVPEELGQLSQLKILNLSDNRLTSLPDELGQLSQLRELNLWDNQLTSLPDELGQLSQLKILNLSGNQLTSLPDKLGQLSQLQVLDLSGNQLMSVPDKLGQLSQLRELNLWDNQLMSVPDELGQLSQLQQLYLDSNRLTQVPKEIGQLGQLERLDLDHNQLIDLPISLNNLSSLSQLYLHENKQLGLPVEILGRHWQDLSEENKPAIPSEILEYYFRTRDGKRPLNEAKLILVGRGGVGKTSLVNRLVHQQFDPGEQKTEGIKITEWKIFLKEHEEIRLNVWDFGGQEIMHATHQFFLTQRSLYLLVLNGREGGEDVDAEYWLKLIESFGGESPVIVVLNKIKEHPFELNYRALQQKYPNIRGFVKTECKEDNHRDNGIAELQKLIEGEADRLENLRDAFPSMWFEIKNQLSRTEKNYMAFEQYRDFCLRFGEPNKAAQEILARYLHQLGIVLNFKDDPRLQDTHVLNPHWVTTGIYKILNSDKLAQQKGEIHLNDVTKILNPDAYPSHMRRFVFDLMKKFDLCFSFPNDECHYLIPELLDKQEPEETGTFDPEMCLNFQYKYPILPEGLLPRFIVRTHHLSEKVPRSRWRTGVILEFEGNRALVKADVQDNIVQISVLGSLEGRRRLLTLIRIEFDSIHRAISNLQPEEMVPLPGYPKVAVPYEELRVREEAREKEFSAVANKKLIKLDVQELLNGVDLARTRRRERTMDGKTEPVRVFYSYSHKDEYLLNDLEPHLKLLRRQGLIESWKDRQIEAGEEWKEKIDENLERADIILLLISADFIASDYCYEKEMARALERHEEGSARVIPVILRTSNWHKASFGKLQALPKDGKPITTWTDRDAAWTNVAQGIERAVETIQKKRQR